MQKQKSNSEKAKETKEKIISIHECRYIENYRFSQCCLKKCKNYSPFVESRCIAVSRVDPIGEKAFSDAELLFFKLRDEGIQARAASLKRKEAVDRIKGVMLFSSYIQFLNKNYKEKQQDFELRRIHIELSKEKIFKSKTLGFESWMWQFVENKKIFEEFKNSVDLEVEFTLDDMLCLSKPKMKQLLY